MKKKRKKPKWRPDVLILSAVLIISIMSGCGGEATDEPQTTDLQSSPNFLNTVDMTEAPSVTPASETDTAQNSTSESGNEMVPAAEPKNELYGVKYEFSGGDMVYRSEFEIEVNREEVVSCAFWPEEDYSAIEMTRKKHIPISQEQWADIERIVDTLLPLMKEIPEHVLLATPDPDLEILDGGDYSNWYLTWETEEGLETIQYYEPQDRRITTLETLLRELADPQGREIIWYSEPVICGLYFSDTKNDYSWQMTLKEKESSEYRYITYYTENGEKRSLNIYVNEDVWNEAYEFISTLNLRDFPDGGYKDKYYCTLYISDYSQQGIKLDKKTAAAMREFFMGFTEKVRKENS